MSDGFSGSFAPSRTKAAAHRDLRDDLEAGVPVTDRDFDRIYPMEIQRLSEIHWTPVEVAKKAAQILVEGDDSRVLDVGSGCGKFCLIGASTTPGTFYGVEQRTTLVAAARSAARRLSIDRAQFFEGRMEDLEWGCFNAFYLFNPFYEHKAEQIRIDKKVSYGDEIFSHYVKTVQDKLKALPLGTRVATYHGFGGTMPGEYQLVSRHGVGTDYVNLWVKRRAWTSFLGVQYGLDEVSALPE